MSALGHEQTSRHVRVMSVIPLKADIHQRGLHVRLVPKADMLSVKRECPPSARSGLRRMTKPSGQLGVGIQEHDPSKRAPR